MAGPKKRSQHWLLWWMVDPDELVSQVDGYRSPNPLKTARGVGAVCLLLSVAITLAFVAFHLSPVSAVLDASVSLLLAVFIFLGHRWAMLAAMGWWRLEKAADAVGFFAPGANAGLVIHRSSGGASTCTPSDWPSAWSRRAASATWP